MEAVAPEADAADAAPALEEVVGDLLEAMEQYIVQQSNCVTSYAHGLAKAIEEKFPHADVYKPAVRTLRRAKWWLRWLSWEKFDLKCLEWWSIMEYHWGMWGSQEGIWLVTTVWWGVNAPLTEVSSFICLPEVRLTFWETIISMFSKAVLPHTSEATKFQWIKFLDPSPMGFGPGNEEAQRKAIAPVPLQWWAAPARKKIRRSAASSMSSPSSVLENPTEDMVQRSTKASRLMMGC